MATNEFRDAAAERDNDLVHGLCYPMERNMLRELREWIEAELKALTAEAQIQQAKAGGHIAEGLASALEQLGVLSRVDLPEASQDCKDKIYDIQQGTWSDVFDAYDQMQQELAKMMRIVRALLEIRTFIEPMSDE